MWRTNTGCCEGDQVPGFEGWSQWGCHSELTGEANQEDECIERSVQGRMALLLGGWGRPLGRADCLCSALIAFGRTESSPSRLLRMIPLI